MQGFRDGAVEAEKELVLETVKESKGCFSERFGNCFYPGSIKV